MNKLVEAARKVLRVTGWTPSKFAKHKECPQKVLIEDLMHLCPACFKGKVSFEGVCDTCTEPQPEREPLARGNRLDDALTAELSGGIPAIPTKKVIEQIDGESFKEATRHPKIAALVKKLRKTKSVLLQADIILDRGWTPSPKGKFTTGAWARMKLDVLVLSNKFLEIIDWKSGNIDKNKGEIREKLEYHDSMRAYQMGALSTYPHVEARVTMAFLDAPLKLESPFKSLPVLRRMDLWDEQQKWERKIEPMMSDKTFAPRPGYYCSWCPWQKAKGGPCQF
jgi:hypothetical protein